MEPFRISFKKSYRSHCKYVPYDVSACNKLNTIVWKSYWFIYIFVDSKAWAYQFSELSLSNWNQQQQQQQHPWINNVDLLMDIFYLYSAVAHVVSYHHFACPWLSRFTKKIRNNRISSGAISMSDKSEQFAEIKILLILILIGKNRVGNERIVKLRIRIFALTLKSSFGVHRQ